MSVYHLTAFEILPVERIAPFYFPPRRLRISLRRENSAAVLPLPLGRTESPGRIGRPEKHLYIRTVI